MKYSELNKKSSKDLYQMIYDLRKDVLSMNFQRVAGQTFSTAELRKKRRDIARIKTCLHAQKNKIG